MLYQTYSGGMACRPYSTPLLVINIIHVASICLVLQASWSAVCSLIYVHLVLYNLLHLQKEREREREKERVIIHIVQ